MSILSQFSTSVCSRSTQFWFVPSECQSNPLHSNRQIWLHNHILRWSLNWNSDSPIPPKLAIDLVKSWHSNCFFRSYQPEIFHQVFIGKVPACGAAVKRRFFFGLIQKRNWLKVLRNFIFWTDIKIQTRFSP